MTWLLDPALIGTLLTAGLLYGLAVGPLRRHLAPGAAFPGRQAALFYGALVLIYLAEGSPLHELAEAYLFSAHMFQHVLLSYLIPPLLIWGTPDWLLRHLLLNRWVKPAAQFFTQPVAAFVTFSLFFSLWHLPPFYEGALQNAGLHHLEHILFLLSSVLLWWPLMSPLKELPPLSYGGQLVYLFVLPIAQVLAFGAITFADSVLYPTYAAAPRIWLDPLADQALGGAVMKVASLFAFGIPFVVIFFRWYQAENATSRRVRSPKTS